MKCLETTSIIVSMVEGHRAREDKIHWFFDNLSFDVSVPKLRPHYYQER